MTLQEPRPSQVDPIPENVPHSGKIPVDQGGERPVDVFDNTSLLEADARGLIDYPKVDDQPQTRSDAKKSKEAKELGPVRRFIARPIGKATVAVAGVLLAGGIGAGIKAGVDAGQAQGQGTTQEQDPGTVTDPGDTTGENGGESTLSADEQLEQTLTSRPEVGTSEFEAIYQGYEIKGDTPEAVVDSYASNFYAVLEAAMNDIPKTYHDDHIELSIDEMYENLNPKYWGEVYSFATFGMPSSELTGAQKEGYNAFMVDLKTALQQRLLTSNSENPTTNVITNESVTVGPSTESQVNGDWSGTVQSNKDNIVTQINPEESAPQTITIGGIFQKNDSGSWNWVGKN